MPAAGVRDPVHAADLRRETVVVPTSPNQTKRKLQQGHLTLGFGTHHLRTVGTAMSTDVLRAAMPAPAAS